jgi:hypothetical protein
MPEGFAFETSRTHFCHQFGTFFQLTWRGQIFIVLISKPASNAKLYFMAILLKVKWVDKSEQPDPYQRIRGIGGDSRKLQWKHTRAQAIQSIEHGLFAYYVEKGARALKLEVGLAPNGCKYLKTQADGSQLEFLLNLPQCPEPASPWFREEYD